MDSLGGVLVVAADAVPTHAPSIEGVEVHPTPFTKGVGLKNHYKIRVFRQATPLIKRVNLHPLN